MSDPLVLPIGTVLRVAKAENALTSHLNLSQEAKQGLSRATGVFLAHLGFLAEESAIRRKRTTVAVEDILAALDELDIPEVYEGALELSEELQLASEERRRVRHGGVSEHGDTMYDTPHEPREDVVDEDEIDNRELSDLGDEEEGQQQEQGEDDEDVN